MAFQRWALCPRINGYASQRRRFVHCNQKPATGTGQRVEAMLRDFCFRDPAFSSCGRVIAWPLAIRLAIQCV
jgi:hypothetical protein